MDIKEVIEGDFINLFGGNNSQAAQGSGTGFSAVGIDKNVSILSTTDTTTQASTTDTTTTVASSTTDTTTASASTTDTTTEVVNIFANDGKTVTDPVKHEFADISGYFNDRIKSGKFVKIEVDGEDGKPTVFVPKTPEDFDEVIDLQVDYRLEKERKNLVQQVYQSKSPAWQAVLKYSELVDDPSEVVPFIQGVRTVESVAQVDENTEEGAERVVRARLQQRGDTQELIDQQVETLKGADKLVATAKVY